MDFCLCLNKRFHIHVLCEFIQNDFSIEFFVLIIEKKMLLNDKYLNKIQMNFRIYRFFFE